MGEATNWVERLEAATNAHDLEALVGCFAPDYVNETPAHPARGFRGRNQVRENWERIFAFIPDLRATVRSAAFDGGTAWTEWEMLGTRRDGTAHRMAGVIVFEIVRGVAEHARFYLEPVDDAPTGAGEALRDQVIR